MKRKLRMFLPLVCAAILLMGMTAMAATDGKCDTCQAVLRTGAREAGHWETTHMAGTGYYLNGVEITEPCIIQYVKTEIGKYCPNGHGVFEILVQTDEYHSSRYCRDLHY